ncbi:MAG: adenylate/guanylate cyclase domain-containing protein [Alphaproteobacteria bacterium]|nr:adenylate/guanylate cyclase domain-containing protein [Alphaproteobacteria bacterium]
MRRWHGIVVGLLILAAGVGVRFQDPEPLQALRLMVFGAYQRLQPRIYQPAPVRIIDIDEESLQRHGQWPWPRTVIARLIDRLRDSGAATIVMDIVFAEVDRTSPIQVVRSLPDLEKRAAILSALQDIDLPDNDDVLAKAIVPGGVVTGFAPINRPSPLPNRVTTFAFVGADPLHFVPAFGGAIVNLPDLEKSAAGNGAIYAQSDVDGVFHRLPLFVNIRGEMYPSLAAEGLRVGQGAATLMLRSSDQRDLESLGTAAGISKAKIGAFVVPTDPNGRMWLYDTGRVPERTIPAWEVLDGNFDPSRVEGMIAVVGVSAEGLSDVVATPLIPRATGAELNAQAMEQILLQDFLQRPLWAKGGEVLYLILLGLALTTAFLVDRFGAVMSTVLGGVLVAAGVAISWWAYAQHGLLLDPVYPVLIGTAIYLSNSIMKYIVSEAQRKEVRGAFSQYVAPALVDELARNPSALKLGGENRQMTVLFCDVRNFTAISEQLDPEGLTHLLNRFLTVMTRLILSRRGTIDKYMGDAIMAFWNAPLPDQDHVRNACATALAMVGALPDFDEELKADTQYNGFDFGGFRCGIGLNTGPCLVGNMGSEQRFDYSVLGNTVNMASRFEGQCKTYGVPIIVGESTHDEVTDFAMLELDLVRVVGKREATRIFALLGDDETARTEHFENLHREHTALLSAYRQQHWDIAQKQLEICRRQMGEIDLGGLYDLYLDRLVAYMAEPPGADWDGVFDAKTK